MNTSSLGKGNRFDFEKNFLVNNYIEKIAKEYPHMTAVRYGSDIINYKNLNEKANQIAIYLIQEENVASGDIIGICFYPCIELIIFILAILKAGATYIPIDISYPRNYTKFILNDANPKIIITNTSFVFDEKKTINTESIPYAHYSKENFPTNLTPDSPLYIIYTSGSTGNPKGVIISHKAANNHMLWMCDYFNFNMKDKFILKTPLMFDPSVWEIFVPLFIGAELVVSPQGTYLDTNLLIDLIVRHKITVIQFVPIFLKKILENERIKSCISLKKIFVGGETLPAQTKVLFFEKLKSQLINLYGPSETTIDATSHIVQNELENLNVNYIGKPIYNTQLFILNEEMENCAIGEEGELYISGDSLAIGYLNQPGLTRRSFLKNPSPPREIMYKTGDIVKWARNGLIEYVCRKDKQTKINGVRVEIDAIASKILEDKDIENCTILKEEEGSYSYLTCCITLKIKKQIDIAAIKKQIEIFFPRIMVPRKFHVFEKLPLLPNGKVDNKKIEEILQKNKSNQPHPPAKSSSIQKDLLEKCQHLLNNDSVDLDDDIYDSGIDSLLAITLMEYFEQKHKVSLLIHEMLSHKTVRGLSNLLIEKLNHSHTKKIYDKDKAIICLKKTGHKTPLFLIHPIGGTVFWYNHLIKYFDPDRPLYAIQDPGLESEEYFFKDLHEMAELYFSYIQQVQPVGPYIIGGASFGSTVAIEICQNLTKKEVVVIPMLDGWGVYPGDLKDENYFQNSMQRQQRDWADKFNAFGYKEFNKIFTMQKHRLELLYSYKMKKIHHHLLLLKSKTIMDIFQSIDAHDNHWGQYSTFDHLRIVEVNGSHETMFQHPYVKNLSQKLSLLLKEFENENIGKNQ